MHYALHIYEAQSLILVDDKSDRASQKSFAERAVMVTVLSGIPKLCST